jgi:hypothetical protein
MKTKKTKDYLEKPVKKHLVQVQVESELVQKCKLKMITQGKLPLMSRLVVAGLKRYLEE